VIETASAGTFADGKPNGGDFLEMEGRQWRKSFSIALIRVKFGANTLW